MKILPWLVLVDGVVDGFYADRDMAVDSMDYFLSTGAEVELVEVRHAVVYNDRAEFARHQKLWRTRKGDLKRVERMNANHLTNAAHLCLTWQERFGVPMDGERRAMCQNVRDEVVRRRVFEVGK
jgi:hypothetical protein